MFSLVIIYFYFLKEYRDIQVRYEVGKKRGKNQQGKGVSMKYPKDQIGKGVEMELKREKVEDRAEPVVILGSRREENKEETNTCTQCRRRS